MNTEIQVTINPGSKWLASPITRYEAPLPLLRRFIPRFERMTFDRNMAPIYEDEKGPLPYVFPPLPSDTCNHFYDTIVRLPIEKDESPIPVGIVSKLYSLIQHQDLFDEVLQSLATLQLKPEEISAQLELTMYGERMRLSLEFPDKFGFEVSKGDRMAFTLECYNSVDGSMKFMAVLGWLRLVCTNGMVRQEQDSYYRRKHNQYLEMKDIATVLREGIESTTREQRIYKAWAEKKVTETKLEKWTNGTLAKAWGIKAATRTWHITKYGHDVTLADPFQKGKPTEKDVNRVAEVPGAVLPGDSVYAVSQALSWLAKERGDVQERLLWKQQIPELVKPLMGARGI
jgi:hypothetical protein